MRYRLKTDNKVLCYDEVTRRIFTTTEKRLEEIIADLNWELTTRGMVSLDHYAWILFSARESILCDNSKGFAKIDDKSRFRIQQVNDNEYGIDYVIVPPNM